MLRYKALNNISSSVDVFRGVFKDWNAACKGEVSGNVDISPFSFPSNNTTFS